MDRFDWIKINTKFFIFNDNKMYIKITETTAKILTTGEIIVVDKNVRVLTF